jgi:tetratricopeptide (TPR) repeat protein
VATAPPTPAPATSKRLLVGVLVVLLVTGAGVGAYLVWRPRPTPVPPIRTDGLDAEVAAAINQARADVEVQPQSAVAWGTLGLVLFAQDLYADCAPILAEAERLDATDARWPYFRGLAVILSQPDEGIALLERAVQLAPASVSTRLRLAEEYWKLERIDGADAIFRALLDEDPANPRALLGHGRVLLRRGQCQDALEPLTTAAKAPTAQHSAHIALAEAYLRLGDAAAAETERRLAADGGDVPWHDTILAEADRFRLGLEPRLQTTMRLADQGRLEDALHLSEQALEDHPASDEAHLTRAKVLIRAKRFGDAEKELRRAVALNPNLVEGHFLLGSVLVMRKEYDAAERSYLRAIALKPTHGLALYNLGECRLKQPNRAGAIEAFRDAVRAHPDLAAGQLRLGELLLEDGKVAEATTHLEQAVRLDGKNDHARELLEKARKQSG